MFIPEVKGFFVKESPLSIFAIKPGNWLVQPPKLGATADRCGQVMNGMRGRREAWRAFSERIDFLP